MCVVWTDAAIRNVKHAHDYIAGFNSNAATHLVESLLVAGDSLATFPHRGQLVPNSTIRELVTAYPYVIRYRIDGDIVVILRIRHTSRRPG